MLCACGPSLFRVLLEKHRTKSRSIVHSSGSYHCLVSQMYLGLFANPLLFLWHSPGLLGLLPTRTADRPPQLQSHIAYHIPNAKLPTSIVRKALGDERIHGESRVRVTPCDGLPLFWREHVKKSADLYSLLLKQVHLRNNNDPKGNESYYCMHCEALHLR